MEKIKIVNLPFLTYTVTLTRSFAQDKKKEKKEGYDSERFQPSPA